MVQELRNTNPYCLSRMWVASTALLKTFMNEMFFGLELTLNYSEKVQRPTPVRGQVTSISLELFGAHRGSPPLLLQCFTQTL